MSVHTFTNASAVWRILGSNRVVAPAASIQLDTEVLIAQDLDEIDAGYFTVTPALPADIRESIGETDKVAKLIAYVISADRSVLFVGAPGPVAGGLAAGAGIDVIFRMVDGDGTVDTFNDVDTVNVAVTGSAVLTGANPRKFVDGVYTLHITDAIAETVTLSLSGGTSATRGLTLSSTLQVLFS